MIRYTFLILFVLRLGSAIGQDSLYYATPEKTKIDVKVNETFIIKLRVCHSCGFRWTMEQHDTINVKLISVTSKNANGRENWSGGDVFEFWKFTGIKAGTYNLEFVQKRPGRESRENGRCNFEVWVK
jgi:predicted secreted protein